jgi:3-isopropylmalate/(R)-2-methylmalate dehydratase large subunit
MTKAMPQTLFDKIWNQHVVTQLGQDTLLYVDRCLIHEGSRQAFDKLAALGQTVRSPSQVIACADHYLPTARRHEPFETTLPPEAANMIRRLDVEAERHGFRYFGAGSAEQGILHVVAPELGLTLPGMTIVGGDSHTSTHGAFGTLAFGAGNGDIAHVLSSQTIWERRPRTLQVWIDGCRDDGTTAKDIILHVIARLGSHGPGHVIEYAGPVVDAMTMEERMTMCNMSIEAGARAGLVAPDDTTFSYLHGRRHAPAETAWKQAVASWRTLRTDAGAAFDVRIDVDVSGLSPMVTWGTNPAQTAPVDGNIPLPSQFDDPVARAEAAEALDYMGLQPGQPLNAIAVDIVFIGSCTNARIEDLRAAAAIARLGRASVPAWVVPGSSTVKRQAEAEGLDRIFVDAGFEWRDSACSLCTAINGVDTLKPGQRCASTSNRNFRGRQGPGARTHLMSPAMAAATAITGRITDYRQLMGA